MNFESKLFAGGSLLLTLLSAACNTQGQIQNAFSPPPATAPIGDSAFMFTPSSFDFGPMAIFSAAKTTVITLTNAAASTVFIASITGTNAAGFTVVSDTCPRSPQGTAAGSTCTVTLQLSPTLAGVIGTSINVNYGPTSTAAGYLSSLSVTGTGVGTLVFGGITSISPVTTTTATLNWTMVAGAIQYLVYQISAGGNATVIANVDLTQSSYAVTGLVASTAYSYEMRAMDILGTLTNFSPLVSTTTKNLGIFTAISGLSTAEGGNVQTPALSCTDIYGSAPVYSVLSQSDSLSQCAISGNTVACAPEYHTLHAAWTSTVVVQCALDGTNYSQSFVLSVADTNRAPSLAAVSNQTVLAGVAITQVSAVDNNTGTTQDIDLDPLAFSCTFSGGGFSAGTSCASLPGTYALGAGTGIFNWTPSYAAGGSVYTVVLTASDQQAAPLSNSQSFTVTVTPATPLLTTIANYNFPNNQVAQGTLFSFDFNNIRSGNPGNDTGMTYACQFDRVVDGLVNAGTACTALPGTATFDTATGIINWTPGTGRRGRRPGALTK
jgi:hypothetical protein